MKKILFVALPLVVAGCASTSNTTTSQVAVAAPNAKAASSQRQLFGFCQDDKWGYFDQTGKIVITPRFIGGKEFHDGRAWVVVENGTGHRPVDQSVNMIDEDGKIIVAYKSWHIDIEDFSGGLAAVAEDHHTYGFVDKSGSVAIPFQFGSVSKFSEGVCQVGVGGSREMKNGFIDVNGKYLFNPRPVNMTSFSEGLAAYSEGEDFYQDSDDSTVSSKEGRCGFINKEGEIVIKPQFFFAAEFSDGMALVSVDSEIKKNGYIDKTGKMVIKPRFAHCGLFHEGLAPVEIGNTYGFMDKTGTVVIKPEFDSAIGFSEDMGIIRIGDSYGYIDRKGKIVINPQFVAAGPFVGGVAVVAEKHEGKASGMVIIKKGLIDKQGRYVLKPIGTQQLGSSIVEILEARYAAKLLHG